MKSNSIDRLKNPTELMRPAPFWSWNDKLDEQELRRQIREMAEKGWGSYFMHSRVGLVTGYLSDDWMKLVNACCDEAEKTGTYAWLYDEDKWPSGFAGGRVSLKNEAYRARKLVLMPEGEATQDDTVLCKASYGGLNYEVCKRVLPLGNLWFNGTSYVDLMNADAVQEFINCTHEKYKQACGHHFGKSIPGVFTDEPVYYILDDNGIPAVPWTDKFADVFLDKKGYNILDKLPLLFFDEGDYRKIRYDFYETATELFKQNFTKPYFDWCNANNLIMTGHFMSEDTMYYQTLSVGDVMSHYEFMHWPGVDKLRRHIDQIVTIKQLTSVADQLGKERAFSEMYGCVGGQVSFFHRKWIGDWQAALGINFVNHHLSLYSMRGERKRDYPANFFYQQPWWEDERAFADYQARLCVAASDGKRSLDILLLQPLASVWSEYSPLHTETDYAAEKIFDKPFADISRRLMEEKLDHHYGNENIMANHASAENGTLSIGAFSYSCVIVPPTSNIKSSTLRILRKFAETGGKLVFVRSLPVMVDGEETHIEIPGATIVTSIEAAIGNVSQLRAERIKVIDRLTGVNAKTVYVHIRKLDNSTRYLLVNTDEKREVRTRVSIQDVEGATAVFDLWDGSFYKLPTQSGEFDVTIAPAGSLLVVCGNEVEYADKPIPSVLGSGAMFEDYANSIPVVNIDDFECEISEENVLVLNDFVLELDGENVYEGPVCGAWHKHFYSAEEGTKFKASYAFRSECAVEGCFAAIEVAENLDMITFNGEKVVPIKSPGEMGAFDSTKSWKDINFTKVPLPAIAKGINNLVIEGVKSNNITGPGFHVGVADWRNHHATEAEEVYICGRFSLTRVSDSRFVMSQMIAPKGKNLVDEGFPFYCGRVTLRSMFDLPQEAIGNANGLVFKLSGAQIASAVVKINGVVCGTVMWEPFMLDVSDFVRCGENSLEVEMATTLVNAFGPNRIAGIKEDVGVGPYSFFDMDRFKQGYELFDFGIRNICIYNNING